MDNRVELIIALMKADLRRELSTEMLARYVNLSVSRLQHLFKLETGMTLVRYRNMLRINRARDLLETSLLSIKEIRARVGINERSHFVREFKNIYGLTPIQYRTASFSLVKRRRTAPIAESETK